MARRPVPPSPPAPELADRLHTLAVHMLRRLRRADDLSGLSAPRLSALSVIVFSAPISLGDLAAAEQVRPPTMTRIIQDLSALGLVRVLPNPDDRRSVLIQPSAKGKRLLEQGRTRRIQLLQAALEHRSEKDRTLIRKALAILEESIQSIGESQEKAAP